MSPFTVYYVKLPSDVGGAAGYDTKNDRYIIAVNDELTEDEEIRTLKHELSHILLDHHNQFDRDLEEIENEADRYADQMTDEEFSELMTYQVGETVRL